MHRVSAAVWFMLIGALGLSSGCCVSQEKYNAVLLRNREQEKLLQEKEAGIARLQERVNALDARLADCQRLIEEKNDQIASIQRERDELRKAFDDLMEQFKALSGRPAVAPMAGGLPGEVRIGIQALMSEFPGLFQFDEAEGRLRVASDITFDSGSNVVKPPARSALSKLAQILATDVGKDIRATVIGHTDSVPVKKATTIALLKELGKATNNQGLSQARAESVRDILVAGGVDARRILTQGQGASQPVSSNDTREGQAQNRRVDIFLR